MAFFKRGSGKAPKLNRRQAWQDVARRIGGTFEEGKRSSLDCVTLVHGPWTVKLDTYTVHTGQATVTFTRARAFFGGLTDLRLRIRKRNIFDTILENVGFGGITPGNRELASRYVVKGRPDTRLRALLTGGLTAALIDQSSCTLNVKKAPRKQRRAYGPNTREATVTAAGVIKDPDRLAGMITIAQELLDALAAVGTANRESPVTPGGRDPAPSPGQVT